MDAAKIFEGIARLIDLAQRGEINPWDVQVIEVIDRYLSELFADAPVTSADRTNDLSQSGQAFLSASMLVLFKANTLAELESPFCEPDASEDDFLLEVAEGTETRVRLPLEQQLRRRPAALPPQKRRVTLKELIDQLQLMATGLQLASAANALSSKTNKGRLRSQSRAEAFRATLELAHQENLTEVAGELEQFLNLYSPQLTQSGQDWLNLDRLVELWSQTTRSQSIASSNQNDGKEAPKDSDHFVHHPQPRDQVSVFWALLLLSAQSKVELAQEEFYQEIKIRALSDLAVVADADKVG